MRSIRFPSIALVTIGVLDGDVPHGIVISTTLLGVSSGVLMASHAVVRAKRARRALRGYGEIDPQRTFSLAPILAPSITDRGLSGTLGVTGTF